MRNQKQIEAEYIRRRWFVRQLSRRSTTTITVVDLQATDRLGRFSIAVDLWNLCDSIAKQALLNDGHAHVRSAARCSEQLQSKQRLAA